MEYSPSWLMVVNRACCACVDACRRTAGETDEGRASRGNEAGRADIAQDTGNHGHLHQDAVTYLVGLAEEGAAVVRLYEVGQTRYWIEGDEVRSLEVMEDEPFPALLMAVSGGVRAAASEAGGGPRVGPSRS